MMTAKVFENGRSQAVRLPKEYRFEENEVNIHKVGDVVMMFPKSSGWESFAQALNMFSEDYMVDRKDDCVQERENL